MCEVIVFRVATVRKKREKYAMSLKKKRRNMAPRKFFPANLTFCSSFALAALTRQTME